MVSVGFKEFQVWWSKVNSFANQSAPTILYFSPVVIIAMTKVFDGTVPSKIIFSFPCNPYFKPNFTCLLTLFLANNFGEKEKYSFWRNGSIKNFRQMVTNRPYFQIKDCGCRLTGPINPLNNCQRKCSLISLQKKRGHLSFIYSQSKMTGCTYICKANSFDVCPRKWHDDIKFSFILPSLRVLMIRITHMIHPNCIILDTAIEGSI